MDWQTIVAAKTADLLRTAARFIDIPRYAHEGMFTPTEGESTESKYSQNLLLILGRMSVA